MVECAKHHGHNPEAWLTDVLERLPTMTNRKRSTEPHYPAVAVWA
jgi:hypothetical protein